MQQSGSRQQYPYAVSSLHNSSSQVARGYPASVVGSSVMGESVGDGASYVSFRSGQSRILGERRTESRIRVPKKILKEETYEKVIVVPEVRYREEVVEEEEVIQERVIEIEKPIIQERIVEVPQVETRERIVKVPEVVVKERVRPVKKIEWVDRPKYVMKTVEKEKIVEVPNIEYREIPIVRTVAVPQIEEETVIKENPVPRVVDTIIPKVHQVRRPYDVNLRGFTPVGHERVVDLALPQVQSNQLERQYRLIVPKFVEVPVPRAVLDDHMIERAERLNKVAAQFAPGSSHTLQETHATAMKLASDDFLASLPAYVAEYGLSNLNQRYMDRQLRTVDPQVGEEEAVVENHHDRGIQESMYVSIPKGRRRRHRRRRSEHKDASSWLSNIVELATSSSKKRSHNHHRYAASSSSSTEDEFDDDCSECERIHEQLIERNYYPTAPRWDPVRWINNQWY